MYRPKRSLKNSVKCPVPNLLLVDASKVLHGSVLSKYCFSASRASLYVRFLTRSSGAGCFVTK